MRIAFLAVWPPFLLLAVAIALTAILAPAPASLLPAIGACILVFDIRARLSDFRKTARLLSAGPAQLPRQVSRFKRSWCQRTVVEWAARRALGPAGRAAVRREYFARGYRWYHVFPDQTFTAGSPFLKPRFWIGLLGGTPEDPGETGTAADFAPSRVPAGAGRG